MRRTEKRTAVGNSDGMRGPQEVLSDRSDLAAVADSNGTVVSVGVVIAWLRVVLETLHEREKVCRKSDDSSTLLISVGANQRRRTLCGPSFGLEVV